MKTFVAIIGYFIEDGVRYPRTIDILANDADGAKLALHTIGVIAESVVPIEPIDDPDFDDIQDIDDEINNFNFFSHLNNSN